MKRSSILVFVFILLFAACKKEDITNRLSEGDITSSQKKSGYGTDPEFPPVDYSTPTATIKWGRDDIKISHETYNAEYPRVHRIDKNTLILTYQFGTYFSLWDKIGIRRSLDNGATWQPVQILYPPQTGYYGISNPDVLVLKNGWVVLAYVGRGNPDDNAHSNVQVCLSKNKGISWSKPVIVAKGRSWEPSMIQLPGGEVELFYSSEAAWWPGPGSTMPHNQEILMVKTKDGLHWSEPLRVAYTYNNRDGMPTPVILADNKGMVFSIESVYNTYSPWIVWSSMQADWQYNDGVGTTNNNRRWTAATNTWDGGPYLVQLPNKLTVLSSHSEAGRNTGGDWKKSNMLVRIGNSMATNFTAQTYPWAGLPSNEGAFFNSLFVKNDSTIVALATRNYADGHNEIHWKEGKLYP